MKIMASGSIQFSSVQSLSRVRLFVTPWITARQASLSITISWSSLRLTSIKSVMPSRHFILCHPFLLLPLIPPSIRVFSGSPNRWYSRAVRKDWCWSWSEVAQSCPTLCHHMDCNLPGSSIHGIFQARVLEWVAISFSCIDYYIIHYVVVKTSESSLVLIFKISFFILQFLVTVYMCVCRWEPVWG